MSPLRRLQEGQLAKIVTAVETVSTPTVIEVVPMLDVAARAVSPASRFF
jgi:hypothetical protein